MPDIDTAFKRASALGLYYPPDGHIDPPTDPWVVLGLYALPYPVPAPAPPTVVQIAEAIAGRYGQVSYTYRALWLSSSLQFLGDISSAIEDGDIELDNKRPIVRRAQLSVLPDELPAGFDRITDYVKLQIEMVEPVTETTVVFPQGVYKFDEPNQIFDSTGTRWDVDAADISVRLMETNLGGTETVDVGDNYVTEMENICTSLGLAHAIPPTTYTAPVAFIWPWQTYKATQINDLGEAINYFPVWADANGIIRSKERIAPSDEQIDVAYTIVEEPRLMMEPWSRQLSLSGSFFNRAIVLIKDPLRNPIAVGAINNDPNSPISTATHGIEKTKEFIADRAPNSTVMQQIANYYLRDASAETYRAELVTFQDPRRDAHETYTVEISGVEAVTKWRVVGWRLPLRAGDPMTHTLETASVVEIEESAIRPGETD